MKPLAFSPLARDDLEVIFNRIAADKPRVAIRFVEQIEARCRLLPNFPELGSQRYDLATGMHRFLLLMPCNRLS